MLESLIVDMLLLSTCGIRKKLCLFSWSSTSINVMFISLEVHLHSEVIVIVYYSIVRNWLPSVRGNCSTKSHSYSLQTILNRREQEIPAESASDLSAVDFQHYPCRLKQDARLKGKQMKKFYS